MYSANQASITLRNTLRVARGFVPSVVRRNSTRGYSSTMHENDPEVLEREKRRNLTGSQHKTSTPHSYAPGWNEYLASASEANVKADKSTGPVSELQSQTIKYVKARHSDTEDTETNTTAVYTHDTVTGPLSSAKGKEEAHDYQGKFPGDHDPFITKVERKTASEEVVKAERGEA